MEGNMFLSLMGDVFQHINNWLDANMGDAGVTIIICMLSMMALLLFANLYKVLTGKPKFMSVVPRLLLIAILVVAVVWLCTTY